MSPLPVVLAVACVLLVLATGALAAALLTLRRRDAARSAAHAADVSALREQVADLTARQQELAAPQTPARPAPADYLITFDQPDPIQVSTGRVVSATLGEPLIKVAALGHGVRRALREEKRAHLVYQVRREYRRRRKATRSATRAAARRAR